MSKKILICDDEEGIRESLKLILETDFDLILTESAPQCLEVFVNHQEEIGLVLLDVKMPRIDGLQLLDRIKELDEDQPVVVISGYRSVDIAAEASMAGANSYICKPFETDQILECVRKFMS